MKIPKPKVNFKNSGVAKLSFGAGKKVKRM